ncbi:MAG: hypothetical protein P4L73_13325 [Caulobacteraceae bacterium]|nr:hypothetical protein [Caulobacteraceae bacterium]
MTDTPDVDTAAIADRYGRVLATLPKDPATDTPAQADLRALIARATSLELILPSVAQQAAFLSGLCQAAGVIPSDQA